MCSHRRTVRDAGRFLSAQLARKVRGMPKRAFCAVQNVLPLIKPCRASSIVMGALLLWGYLLYQMLSSSHNKVAWHSNAERCPSVPARLLWAPRVVLHGNDGSAAIHINEDGRIAASWPCTRDEAEDYAGIHSLLFEPHVVGDVISPGLVDAAAHLAEWLEPPGRSYEGFSSGTQAAAAGGVTTVIDLPAHARPLTTSGTQLRRKLTAARGTLHVDVGFWAAALPENLHAEGAESLEGVLESGALGFAVVVAASPYVEQPSVVAGTRALTLEELERVLEAAALSDKPVLVHAEVVSDDEAGLHAGADGMDYASWLATRPMRWEEGAVRALLAIATRPRRGLLRPRIHVLRLTDAGCTPLLRGAALREASADEEASTAEGIAVSRVTASSCPHYAMFDAESVVRGDTRLKVAPPLRHAANRRKLWQALLDGSVNLLVSDHTPAPLEQRAGSFFDAFTGISGLQFTLPATWTEGREHGASLYNLSRWLSEEPAKLSGIWRRKGSIEAGKDADLVVWRPDARTETAAVFHRQPGSPYEDLPLMGRTLETIVRGRTAFRDGAPPLAACGQVILRPSPLA